MAHLEGLRTSTPVGKIFWTVKSRAMRNKAGDGASVQDATGHSVTAAGHQIFCVEPCVASTPSVVPVQAFKRCYRAKVCGLWLGTFVVPSKLLLPHSIWTIVR